MLMKIKTAQGMLYANRSTVLEIEIRLSNILKGNNHQLYRNIPVLSANIADVVVADISLTAKISALLHSSICQYCRCSIAFQV